MPRFIGSDIGRFVILTQNTGPPNLMCLFMYDIKNIHTVKPALRGHLWDKEKVVF